MHSRREPSLCPTENIGAAHSFEDGTIIPCFSSLSALDAQNHGKHVVFCMEIVGLGRHLLSQCDAHRDLCPWIA